MQAHYAFLEGPVQNAGPGKKNRKGKRIGANRFLIMYIILGRNAVWSGPATKQ